MTAVAAFLRRILFAGAAVALLAGGPPMPERMAMPDASHAGHRDGHHGSAPAPHHHHTQCCDLCAAHCGSPLAPGDRTRVPIAAARAVSASLPTLASPVVVQPRYRLPPALAPPPLLA
jgi:hypothetical protein